MRVLDLRRLRLGVLLAMVLALVAGGALRPVTDRDDSSVVVIVGKLDPRDARPEQVVRRLGGEVLHHLSVVSGFTARVPRRVLPALAHAPGVRFAAPNRAMHLLGQYGQDSGVASAVYTDVTRASSVWAAGVTGAGVTVALV